MSDVTLYGRLKGDPRIVAVLSPQGAITRYTLFGDSLRVTTTTKGASGEYIEWVDTPHFTTDGERAHINAASLALREDT